MANCKRCNCEYEYNQDRWSVYCARCGLFYLLEPLAWEQYRARLQELRSRIVRGDKLSYYDDTTIGDKDTSATWGMCAKNLPFPGFYRDDWQLCPFDNLCHHRTGEPVFERMGCFYRCRIFNGIKRTVPTQRQALNLLDKCFYDEPEIEYTASWKLKDSERSIVFPPGTTHLEAKMGVAGIKLAGIDHVYVRGEIVGWSNGPKSWMQPEEQRQAAQG